MRRDGLIFVLIFSVISISCAKNTYVVMFPRTIRPGLVTEVYVNILEATGPVTVTANLQDSKNITVASGTKDISVGTPSTVQLKIPIDLKAGLDYGLKIEGTGGQRFANWSKVSFQAKSTSILIQTDKAIYKPGQTIQFRILGVYPDLSIVKQTFDIDIYDPKGNKIAQWRDAAEENGVFADKLVMSDHPVLGDWKMKVTQGVAAEEKVFTVDEYVLPKFEVTVDLPPYGLTTDLMFHGTVKAKYTYGKSVSGNANIRLKKKYNHRSWGWRQDHPEEYVDSIEQSFPIDGESKFTFSLGQLKRLQQNLAYTDFVIEANVTEGVTGLKMKDSAEIKFYDNPAKIDFVESLPANYKPGLIYTALLKVTQPDDKPVVNPSSRVKVEMFYNVEVITTTTTTTTTTTAAPLPEEGNLTAVVEALIEPEIYDPWRGPLVPPTERVPIPVMYLDINPDGLVKFDIDVPNDAVSFDIEARYMKESAYKYLQPFKSPSKSFIQVRLLNEKPMAGQTISIDVKATEAPEKVFYQMISKGNIVKTGEIPMGGLKQTEFKILITPEMAPKARLIINYVRPDGEIVTDGVTFSVDGIFKNKVSLKFMKDEVLPGSNMLVDLQADPKSQINVLAVDKSVLLLKTGNDISEDQITKELQSYDNAGGGYYPYYARMWYWPSTGRDASDVFDNNGMTVLTDALLYNYQEPFRPIMLRRGGTMLEAMLQGGAMPMANMAPEMSELGRPAPSNLKPVTKVRKLFPETWLWQNISSGDTGKTTINVKVPDTITSWVATAFAVNPESGLGLTAQPSNLNVFMPFFMQLVLPYSVVRGELVVLQINIHNYLATSEWVLVILEKKMDMENEITYSSGARKRMHAKVGRWIKLMKGGIGSVFFPIVPIAVGQLKISVTAQTASASDAVDKDLLVEPSGTAQEYNIPVLIDLKTVGTFNKTVNITFPANTTAGSRRVTASVIGDLMGPSINGLEKLIKMPYGCGEQNMLNFAPNIFVRRYLNVTNNLSSKMDSDSKEYMIKGYQRELTYQHDDGSFSAFGNSDKSGTTWLTAFVVKSFAQASDDIFIDDKLFHKALDWLVLQQTEIGTFKEPGKVLHKAMQGGSAAGERSLTAFVLIAMKEADVIKGASDRTARSIKRATTYLEGEVDRLIDTYEMAIVSYALKLVNSPKSIIILERLKMLAVDEDGTRYWKHNAKESNEKKYSNWSPPHSQSNAIDIELTSYILMNYAMNMDVENGLPVLRWLTSQRNPNGGFCSTQDTIIALQALAEFAGEIYSNDFNMEITIKSLKGEKFEDKHIITRDNALVLKVFEVPIGVEELTVFAKGKGVSLAEVAVYFYTADDIKTSAFDINTTISEETTKGLRLQVCGRWRQEGETGMSIMEIGIPSGMTPDYESLDFTLAPEYKRKEELFRKLVLYFDKFDALEQCVSLNIVRTDRVAELQPSPVRIYDYYEPSKQKTSFYSSKLLEKSTLCDVCGTECFCKEN
ncbi:CD109 antigen-like isoform X2 [Mytilus trossulus]|uniref:CD109 antigen-like isoform X2 n=1 Tax=Mytilus trossulus TaxID=6551 RepID=UPI003003E364